MISKFLIFTKKDKIKKINKIAWIIRIRILIKNKYLGLKKIINNRMKV
jgi:hypothetical protein